jgi:hypothetical protein
MNKNQQIVFYILLPFLFAAFHWVGVRIYSAYCAPSGFYGLMITMFNTANPFCSYNLQMIELTRYFYNQAWIVIGLSSVGLLKTIFQKNIPPTTSTPSETSNVFL